MECPMKLDQAQPRVPAHAPWVWMVVLGWVVLAATMMVVIDSASLSS